MTEELQQELENRKQDIIGGKISVFRTIDDKLLIEYLGEDFPAMAELKLALVGLNLGKDIVSYKLVGKNSANNMQGFSSTGEYQTDRVISETGFKLLLGQIKSAFKSMENLLNAEEGTFSITGEEGNKLPQTVNDMKNEVGLHRQAEVSELLDNLLRPKTDGKVKGEFRTSFFEVLDAKSKTNRAMLYNHWEAIYNNFIEVGQARNEQFQETFRALNMNDFTLSDEEKRMLENIKFPIYVVKFPQVNVLQHDDDKTAIGLLNDFTSSPSVLGQTLERYHQVYRRGETESSGEVNPDEVAQDVIEDLDIKLDKDGDPLFMLESIKDSEFFTVDEQILSRMYDFYEEMIGTNNFSQEVREMVLNSFEVFINKINIGIENREKYYLPILDNNIDVIKKFRQIISRGEDVRVDTISYEYKYLRIDINENNLPDTILEEGGMYSYPALCAKINKDAKNAFDTLANMIERQPRTFLSRKNVKALGYQATGTDYLSGKGANITGLIPETKMVSEYAKYLIETIVQPLYIEEMNGRFFFGKDVPEFIKTEGYTQVKDSVKKTVGRQIRTQGVSVIQPEDLDYLTKYFKSLKMYSRVDLTTLRSQSKNAVEVFNKIANLAATSRKERTRYNERIQDALGNIIFDIYETQGVDATQVNTIFIDKPIKEYQSAVGDDNLIITYLMELISDPDFERYANREGGMQKNLAELRKTLQSGILSKIYDEEKMDLSKSYTIATDMIRKSKGLTVYKAYMDINDIDDVDYAIDLIYKEDRVDIYAHDIETILTLNISNDTMASGVGLNPNVIYKIKGLFR